MTKRFVLAPLLSLLVLAACGGGSAKPTTPADEPTPVAGDPSCPVAVPGTSVTVEDTPTGAALVFVTTGDAAEVRRRVTAFAGMHNDHHGKMGPLPTGTEPAGAGHGDHGGHGDHAAAEPGMSEHAGHAGGMIRVHSRAEASDVEGGARVTFTVTPGDVAAVQSELRMHANHLAGGTCAMPGDAGGHAGH